MQCEFEFRFPGSLTSTDDEAPGVIVDDLPLPEQVSGSGVRVCVETCHCASILLLRKYTIFCGRKCSGQSYLSKGVYKVVMQKLIPAQLRQLILYIGNDKRQIDVFVGGLTLAKRYHKHFL